MNHLEAALLEVVEFLEARGVRYMVVGGFASLHWGRQRLTEDLDLTVEVPFPELAAFVEDLGREFKLTTGDPLEFARRNHLIRLMTRVSVPADLMLAALPYQVAALNRAVEVPVGPRTVSYCTPEDLIIYKLASERPQDHIDVEGVVLRQSEDLDRKYLDPYVHDLAAGLGRPDVLRTYSAALKRAGLPDPPPVRGSV
ncbi:MAG: nucleotidyltransferase [Candidatus Eiseniibacteriota bacterium]